MECTIWHLEQKIQVLCFGHFTYETKGYYAGCGSVDDFKVFHGNDNITAELDAIDLKELEDKFLQFCLQESVA
jgi:hypothetical protein